MSNVITVRRVLAKLIQKRSVLLIFFLSFAFFTFVMACAPYASDDLEFGNLPYTHLSEYLQYALEYGNGRLLGNLTAILLSSVRWLNVLVKAAVLSSMVVLIPSALDLHGAGYSLVTLVLMATVDPTLFGEVYVWTSGFSNYVPPIWMSLVILFLFRRYHRLCGLGIKPMKLAIFVSVFFLGLASQLFIEHSSGVNLLMAFCAFVLFFRRKEQGRRELAGVWLVATALGLLAMLLIPKIFYIPNNHTETYRDAHLDSLAAMLLSCGKNVIQLSNHFYGPSAIPLCFGALSTIFMTRSRRSEKANRILTWLASASAIYLALSLCLGLSVYLGKAAIIQHIFSGFFAFLPFVLWVIAARDAEGTLRRDMLLCLTFAFVSLLPLLVVTPIPCRVIYQACIFVQLAALRCCREYMKTLDTEHARRYLRICAIAAVLVCVLLSTTFASVAFMSRARDRHIRREIDAGATEIVVFSLPYRYTTWDHLWSLDYQYPSEQEVQFSILPFETWMNDFYR